jgi:hypothetical protein
MKRYQTIARLFQAITLTALFLAMGLTSTAARATSAASSAP